MTKTDSSWIPAAFVVHAQRIKDGAVAVELDELTRCWCCGSDEKKLQKCHIVPKSLGGEDVPGNLIPLCLYCHDEAPDVDDPEIMWIWIAEKQNFLCGVGHGRHVFMWDAIMYLSEKYAFNTNVQTELVIDWYKWLMENKVGFHMGQNRKGVYVKDSSCLWAIEEAFKRAAG